MKKYFVIGGEYTSTEFVEIHQKTAQELGPFDTYRAAQNCWQTLSMRYIDDALSRFKIITVDEEDRFWVVGGIYESTQFEKLDSKHDFVELGPFYSQQDAEKNWRDVSMQYVDNALARFRIEQR